MYKIKKWETKTITGKQVFDPGGVSDVADFDDKFAAAVCRASHREIFYFVNAMNK